MNRREALIGVAAGTLWIGDQSGRQPAARGLEPQTAAARGPRPWDLAVFPTLSVSQTEIRPGAPVVHLKLVLDRDPFMTVRVLLVVPGDHSRGFRGEDLRVAQPFVALWSPGDDLVQYVSIPIRDQESRAGWKFRVTAPNNLRQSGWADSERGLQFDVKVVEQPSEPNRLPGRLPSQRQLHRLKTGRAGFDQDMAKIEWSRTGRKADGTAVWRTSLQYSDGPANGNEKGLYANAQTYPGSDPHLKEVDHSGRPYVRLHTRRFTQPTPELDFAGRAKGRSLPFQASLLSGQTLPGLCHATGLWEFEFVSPDRYGAWSAHWMMGVENGRTVWPPEIDVFEHFNGAYGPWDARKETSSTLHYGDFGKGRAGSRGAVVALQYAGFGAGVDLTANRHLSQCLVTDNFITIFLDGVEIVQFRHILKPVTSQDTRTFHPLVNVAVAPARDDDPYNQGSGDMLFYGYRYYPVSEVFLDT